MSDPHKLPPSHIRASVDCVTIAVIVSAVGFNALFCHAGYVDELEGSLMRLLIGGILGLLFGLLVVLEP